MSHKVDFDKKKGPLESFLDSNKLHRSGVTAVLDYQDVADVRTTLAWVFWWRFKLSLREKVRAQSGSWHANQLTLTST
jgi:hypothetical protein